MTFTTIERILKANGWLLIRVLGSKYQYRKVNVPYAIVIPDHNGADIPVSVIKDLEKISGLDFSK